VATDESLAKIYKALWASEKGHYLSFIDLARQVAMLEGEGASEAVEDRWQMMLLAERTIIMEQKPGPRMHSWVN
jgi:tRNA 2-(methylsulfanyl)-N6-isopentenyladenosine37 hydroxylase